MKMNIVLNNIVPQNQWMRRGFVTIFVVLVLLITDMIWVRIWRHIPIGYATTRLTGPLLPNGAVDYATAMDHVYGVGVTPENNAVPLLLEAVWSVPVNNDPGVKAYRTKLLAMLHIKPFKTHLRIYDYWDWVIAKLGTNLTNAQWKFNITRVDPTFRLRPWTAQEFPLAAQWVHNSAGYLMLLHQAVQRPYYYLPIIHIVEKHNWGSYNLWFRFLAVAATARAMFRLGQGDTQGAIQDIADTQRLAELEGQSITFIQKLKAISLAYMALGAEAGAAGSGQLSKAQLFILRHDTLPRTAIMPRIRQINFQRFLSLSIVFQQAHEGVRTFIGEFEPANPTAPRKPPAFSNELLDALIPINFAASMRERNRFYDRMTTALEKPTYSQRNAAMGQIVRREEKFMAQHPLLAMTNPLVRQLSKLAKNMMRINTGVFEEILVRRKLTLLAVALAIYKCDHGRYPQQLVELVPNYVKKIPPDAYSGKPLIYHPADDDQSFLLYSIGPEDHHVPTGRDRINVRGGKPNTRHSPN